MDDTTDSRSNANSADWLLWQLADSGFPTGGFAQSGGVEAAFQHRELRNGSDLSAWCKTALIQLQHGSIPFVSGTYQQILPFEQIDAICEAFLSNHVANRASRAQGRSLLAVVDRAFQLPEMRIFKKHVATHSCAGHLAPVHGVVTQALQLPLKSSVRLFVFVQLRGWISSAVRLGVIGPLEAQGIQHHLSPLAESAAQNGLRISLDDISQTTPLLDLYQGTQDRLYSRLFQS